MGGIRTAEEQVALDSADVDSDPILRERRTPGRYRTRVRFPARTLNAGRYYVVVGLANPAYRVSYDRIEFASFSVLDIGTPERGRPGVFQMYLPWETTLEGVM